MPNYTYMPIAGELPGKSFERQTVAFFQMLQNQLDELSTRVEALSSQQTNNFEAINGQLNRLRTEIDAAQSTADQAKANIVPSGGIILFNTASLPSGWIAADGSNSTPNLQYYTSGNLQYAQKS